jgi:hypothetical protein
MISRRENILVEDVDTCRTIVKGFRGFIK